jgi:alkylresorcinol/alkylpyrone synthase
VSDFVYSGRMERVSITSAAAAHPVYRISQAEAAARIGAATRDPRRVAAIARGTRIDQRAIALPPDRIACLGTIEERNQVYRRIAPAIAREAAGAALAGTARSRVGCLVTSSCTGYMLPGWGVSLVDELGLGCETVRLPVTEAGCAGGVLGIARAADYLRTRPGVSALAVAAELCSLAFHAAAEEGNLTSTLIFGDGAGAALLETGSDKPGRLDIVDSATVLVPGSREVLGFDLTDRGFFPVLSRRLVSLLPAPTRVAATKLLGRNGLSLADARFWLVHPGGARILSSLEACLHLPAGATRWSWQSLREFGNTSSAAIFDVCRRFLDDGSAPTGPGLVVAFGPGVSIELLLVDLCR